MLGFFKGISERLSNRMMAPGAEEADGYYDEYDDDYDDDYDDEPEFEVRYTKQDKNSRTAKSTQNARTSSRAAQRDNVYGLPQAQTPLALHSKQAETVVMHPKSMEDAVEIGSHVRSGRMGIVDLTGVPTTEAQRVADYLCGISDALDGAITRVNNTIITVSPANHRVMPDYREESPFDAKFLKKASNDR